MRRPALLVLSLAVASVPSGLCAQDTHLLVVSGLGGDAQYRQTFVDWGLAMTDAAEAAGVLDENITFLAEDPSMAPDRIDARSTREEVEAAVARIASKAGPQDRVLVLLIGHGSGNGPDSRVSIPGPSLRASDYDVMLSGLAPGTVALVNVASASGDFIPTIRGEGRVVVTATRSSQQRNATLFGGYFVEAYAGERADTDRDGRVSLLEAFEYARVETDRYYTDRGLIIPETALLEDRLEGEGSDDPLTELGLGLLASRFFLESTVPAQITGDPETQERLRPLYEEQARLEEELAQLRQRADAMDPDEYQTTLTELLLNLAETGAQIREIEGQQP